MAVFLFATVARAQAGGSENATCAADWAQATLRAVAPSVVRIESQRGEFIAAAFVFGSPRHLATALHVVAKRVGNLRARFEDGSVSTFDVVAMDRDHDLAILLVTSAPADVKPLEAYSEPVERGTPVLLVRPTHTASASWEVTAGVVSAVEETVVLSDALSRHGNSGGPLVDCGGRVVGVATGSRRQLSAATGVEQLTRLWAEVGEEPVFRSRVRWHSEGRLAAFAGVGSEGTRLGPAFGYDVRSGRWLLAGESRLAWLVGRHSPAKSEQGQLSSFGFNIQRTLSNVRLGLGAVYVTERRRIGTLGVANEEVFRQRTTAEIEPLVLLRLNLVSHVFDYQFVLDLDAHETSTHWFGFTVPFGTLSAGE